MGKTVAIIQARIDSKRLPGKVLLPLWKNKTVLEIVVARVSAATLIDEVVIATTVNEADLLIADIYINRIAKYYPKTKLYRGHEKDVLQRVYDAADCFNATTIVDITADCPLVDPRHIDIIIDKFMSYETKKNKVVHCSNIVPRKWPDGLDIQVYGLKTLDQLMVQNRLSLDNITTLNHDHAGWNIVKNRCCYLDSYYPPDKYNHPNWGLTLDEVRDYEVLKYLFNKFVKDGDLLFPVEEVLDYLLLNPKIINHNKNVQRKGV